MKVFTSILCEQVYFLDFQHFLHSFSLASDKFSMKTSNLDGNASSNLNIITFFVGHCNNKDILDISEIKSCVQSEQFRKAAT